MAHDTHGSKIFIIEEVDQLTYHYHPNGGIVIIAPDLEAAKQLVSGHKTMRITDKEWATAKVYELRNEVPPEYFVFPDAGCCG